jgi:hypothetical protein
MATVPQLASLHAAPSYIADVIRVGATRYGVETDASVVPMPQKKRRKGA